MLVLTSGEDWIGYRVILQLQRMTLILLMGRRGLPLRVLGRTAHCLPSSGARLIIRTLQAITWRLLKQERTLNFTASDYRHTEQAQLPLRAIAVTVLIAPCLTLMIRLTGNRF